MLSRKKMKTASISIAAMFMAATIFSFSLSVVPFLPSEEKGGGNAAAYIVAAVFWAGLLLMLVASFVTKKALYKLREKLIVKGLIKRSQHVGIISFSTTPLMIVLYIVIVLGLVLSVTDIIFSYIPTVIMFPILSVTILSFSIHCVVDGKYYKAYKLIKESMSDDKKTEV